MREVDETSRRSLFAITYAVGRFIRLTHLYNKDNHTWNVNRCNAEIEAGPWTILRVCLL